MTLNAERLLVAAAGFTQATKDPTSSDRPNRLAVIDYDYDPTSFPDVWPRVLFEGEQTVTRKRWPVGSGYWPAPGDRVLMVPEGARSYIIVCAIEQPRSGWTPVVFENSWGDFGSPWQDAEYKKDMTGRVWLRGTITGGAAGSTAFTLPAGYRPPADYVSPAISSGGNPPALCRLQVNADGTVVPQNAVSSFVGIDTSFDTR